MVGENDRSTIARRVEQSTILVNVRRSEPNILSYAFSGSSRNAS